MRYLFKDLKKCYSYLTIFCILLIGLTHATTGDYSSGTYSSSVPFMDAYPPPVVDVSVTSHLQSLGNNFYLASTSSESLVNIENSNRQGLCVLWTYGTALNLGSNPNLIPTSTSDKTCHYEGANALPSGVNLLYISGTDLEYKLPLQATNSTMTTRLRAIYKVGEGGAVTHSDKTTLANFVTAHGPTISKIEVVDVPASASDYSTGTLFLGANPTIAPATRDLKPFKMFVDTNTDTVTSAQTRYVNGQIKYVCAWVNPTDSISPCACTLASSAGLMSSIASNGIMEFAIPAHLEAMAISTASKVRFYACGEKPGVSGVTFTGGHIDRTVAAVASDNQFTDTADDWARYPGRFLSKANTLVVSGVTLAAGIDDAAADPKISTHVTGKSYSVLKEGRTLYKTTTLTQTQMDSMLEICTLWSFQHGLISNHSGQTQGINETCVAADSAGVIIIPSGLSYGKLKARWKMSSGGVSVFSQYSNSHHFGWFPAQTDISVSIAKVGSSFELHESQETPTVRIIQNYNTIYRSQVSMTGTDSFVISGPGDGTPLGSYTCYRTTDFGHESSARSEYFTSLCSRSYESSPFSSSSGNTNALPGCITGATKVDRKLSVTIRADAITTGPATYVVQHCNPAMIDPTSSIPNMIHISQQYDGPTGENQASSEGRCKFSAAYTEGTAIEPQLCDRTSSQVRLASSPDEVIQSSNTGLKMGEGFISTFPFNYAPVKVAVNMYNGTKDLGFNLGDENAPKQVHSPKLKVLKGQNNLGSVCYTVDGTDPVCGTAGKCYTVVSQDLTVTPVNTRLYRFRGCNTQQSATFKGFRKLSSPVTSGEFGDSTVTPGGYFSTLLPGDFRTVGVDQRCHKTEISSSFNTFELQTGASSVSAVTVHRVNLNAHISMANDDASSLSSDKEIYGLHFSPADQLDQWMKAEYCTCEEFDSSVSQTLHDTFTDAVTTGQSHSSSGLGLFTIYQDQELNKYVLRHCTYNKANAVDVSGFEASVAGGKISALFKTKYNDTKSMCFRNSDTVDKDAFRAHTTRISASLSSGRILDNFRDIDQPADDLACVYMAQDDVKEIVTYRGNEYPVSGYDINSACSADKTACTKQPPVRVLQATSGANVCRDADETTGWGNVNSAGGLPQSFGMGFKADGRCSSGSACTNKHTICKKGHDTFDVIAQTSTKLLPTMGQESVLMETGDDDVPKWTLNGVDVLSECTKVADKKTGSVTDWIRYTCRYEIATRLASSSKFKQHIGSCNTLQSDGSFTSLGAGSHSIFSNETSLTDLHRCREGGSYNTVVTRWEESVSGKKFIYYLLEADQFPWYDSSKSVHHDYLYSTHGAFRRSDGTLKGPGTSILATATLRSDSSTRIQISTSSQVAMTVTTCAIGDMQMAKLRGEERPAGTLMPSFMRTDLMDKGQPIGKATYHLETKAVCSDNFNVACDLNDGAKTNDGAKCGYHDVERTEPRRCGVIGKDFTLTQTNNFLFHSLVNNVDASTSLSAYSGYIGETTFGSLTGFMKANTNLNGHHSDNVWAVYSTELAAGSGSPLAQGKIMRELNFVTTAFPITNIQRVAWDVHTGRVLLNPMTGVVGGQVTGLPKCTVPVPMAMIMKSAITTDDMTLEQASFTTSRNTIETVGAVLSAQIVRKFSVTSANTYDAVDYHGNVITLQSGREAASGSDGALIVKARIVSTLLQEGTPAAIMIARGAVLTLNMQTSDFDPNSANVQCKFTAISDAQTTISNSSNNLLPSLCVDDTPLPDAVALQYFPYKCGTRATSIRSSSGTCHLVAEQGFDFALQTGQPAVCNEVEGKSFTGGKITGISMQITSLDKFTDATDCASTTSGDLMQWKVMEKSSSLDPAPLTICNKRKSSQIWSCTSATEYYNEFEAPVSGGTLTIKATQTVEDTGVVSRLNVNAVSEIGFVHPGIKLQDNQLSSSGRFRELNVETIKYVSYVDVTDNDYTNKKNVRVPTHEYARATSACDTPDSLNMQYSAFNKALCNCRNRYTTDNSLYTPFAGGVSVQRGIHLHGMNKHHDFVAAGEADATEATSWGGIYDRTANTLMNTLQTTSLSSPPSASLSVDPFSTFVVFHTQLNTVERGAQVGVRPDVEVALVYACLTPRSSQVPVQEGARTTSLSPEIDRENVGTKQKNQLCDNAGEVLVYLHWGSKENFDDFVTASNKGNYAVPGCTESRRTQASTTNHGQSTDASEVYDLSEFFVSGVQTTNGDKNCDISEKVGKYKATEPVVQGVHPTYSANTICDKLTVDTAAAQANVEAATHQSDIHLQSWYDEAIKVKANAFDISGNAGDRHGISVCERFVDNENAFMACTLTMDAKLFGSYAKAIEINQLTVIKDSGANTRRSDGPVNGYIDRQSARKLLQAANTGGTSSAAQSGTAIIPNCQGEADNTDNSSGKAFDKLFCLSQECKTDTDLTITVAETSGLTMTMSCKASATSSEIIQKVVEDEDEGKNMMIWTSFTLSIVGSIIITFLLGYFGYVRWFSTKLEKTALEVKDTWNSVL